MAARGSVRGGGGAAASLPPRSFTIRDGEPRVAYKAAAASWGGDTPRSVDAEDDGAPATVHTCVNEDVLVRRRGATTDPAAAATPRRLTLPRARARPPRPRR